MSLAGSSSRRRNRCWSGRASQSSFDGIDATQLNPQVPKDAQLGQGSYGCVWRARDRRNGTWYAVKNIQSRSRIAPSVAQRECEVAAHLKVTPHPCIVGLYQIHHLEEVSLYLLVMEYCPGGNLFDRVLGQWRAAQGQSYQPLQRTPYWLGQVFLGLEHMHLRMCTLLRDLKPENVVLDKNQCAKLTDFGFGRFGVEAPGQWSFGIPTGSPGYVAPEILAKEEYDDRADLYSFGVLMWVMLCGGMKNSGVPPINKERHRGDFEIHISDWRLLRQCLSHPDRVRPPVQQLPPHVRELVARLVQRDPRLRPKHNQIREDRLFQQLELPGAGASKDAVERWLGASLGIPVSAA